MSDVCMCVHDVLLCSNDSVSHAIIVSSYDVKYVSVNYASKVGMNDIYLENNANILSFN